MAMTYSRITKSLGRMIEILAAVAALSASATSFAQSGGIVSGSVLDADWGGAVLNARVTIAETQQSATANADGRFFLTRVPEGQYTLIVSATYYKASRVEEVFVRDGEVTRIEVPLYNDDTDVVELDSFTVKAKVLEDSELGLVSRRQKSAAMSDAISSESFSRLGIGDAADAMTKVTGASIVDNKYVVVRGLSDRYNNTTLNGSSVPSSDPDKRAVQLDQFPSGIIDSITTLKTFTPDKSGSFTGGAIDIKTKAIPEHYFLTISAGLEYNSETTFKDILATNGSGNDWLGSDDGSRSIPQFILDNEDIPLSPRRATDAEIATLDQATKSFSPEISVSKDKAPLNHGFSVAYGNRFMLSENPDNMALGFIGSFNYKRKFSAYDDGNVKRYLFVGGDELETIQDFVETKGADSAQWGTVANFALQINPAHEIGLKTMYNQSGEDEAIFRTGAYPETVSDDTFNINNLHYTERTLSLAQLYGKHTFEEANGLTFEWEYANSKSEQSEPDFRLFYDTTPATERGLPTYTGNFPAPRRYWRDLEETNSEYKIDITLPVGADNSEVKFGINSIETDRSFFERSFIYRDASFLRYDGDESQFLAPEFLGLGSDGVFNRYIQENPGFVPEYFGDQKVDAYYAMMDWRAVDNWRFIFGARNETTEIDVQSFDSKGRPFSNDGHLDEEDWLPALNVVRELGNNKNLRFAYTKTLARPNFRELSPFGSFDNVGGETFVGNPTLDRTLITNYDARYEWFIEGVDLVAASVFYKDLENPIELNFSEGQLTYVNVAKGEVRGVELEARKKIKAWSGERSEFSIGGNFSYVESEVDRSASEIAAKSKRDPDLSPTRELQGQSEILANLDLFWENYDRGTSASLIYNHTGERLYSVTLAALPDVFEAPSNTLDLILAQRLKGGVKIKLALKNLLNDSAKRFLPLDGGENIYSEFEPGMTASLSFSYYFE